MQRNPRTIHLAAMLLALAGGATAAELVVHVDGLPDDAGTISCGLFVDAAGFPDDDAQALTQRHPARRGATICRYEGVPAGRAAVAVSHDRNGNGRLDKNFLGIPREPWGVSNGVRPSLRPPRHAEAAFDVPADGVLEIRVTVAE
jgi:uncharacterized protein (DUF2141 family)